MKQAIIRCLTLVLVAIAGIAMYVPVVEAQDFTTTRPGGRGGNWEFFLPLAFMDSVTINGQGGSNVHINADWNTGFGFGYNINDRFQINGSFTWAYRSYSATIVQTDGTARKYNGNVDSSTASLNGIFFFMPGNLTPFISGGIGMTYVDTNIPTGTGSTQCWYDPWWGYTCSTYTPTKTENDVSYNAGLGVRWDINRQFSMQGSYNKSWLDLDNAATPDFDIYKIDFIFRM